MKKFVLLSILATSFSFAQNDILRVEEKVMEFQWDLDIEEVNDRDCNNIIDPQFPGGEAAMLKFIRDSLVFTTLPDSIENRNGICYVKFVVEADGSVSSFECFRANPITQKDIFLMMEKMPIWSPGLYCGEAKRTRYTLPIHIRWR